MFQVTKKSVKISGGHTKCCEPKHIFGARLLDYSENIQSDEDEREAALSQFPLSFWHIFVDLKCDSIDFTFVSR